MEYGFVDLVTSLNCKSYTCLWCLHSLTSLILFFTAVCIIEIGYGLPLWFKSRLVFECSYGWGCTVCIFIYSIFLVNFVNTFLLIARQQLVLGVNKVEMWSLTFAILPCSRQSCRSRRSFTMDARGLVKRQRSAISLETYTAWVWQDTAMCTAIQFMYGTQYILSLYFLF